MILTSSWFVYSLDPASASSSSSPCAVFFLTTTRALGACRVSSGVVFPVGRRPPRDLLIVSSLILLRGVTYFRLEACNTSCAFTRPSCSFSALIFLRWRRASLVSTCFPSGVRTVLLGPRFCPPLVGSEYAGAATDPSGVVSSNNFLGCRLLPSCISGELIVFISLVSGADLELLLRSSSPAVS